MRRATLLMSFFLAGMLVLGGTAGDGWAQQKKLVYWTHWEQNPDFNKWY